MGFWNNQLSGPTDPVADAAWEKPGPRGRGRELTAMLAEVRAAAGVTVETGTRIDTAAGSPHPAHVEDS